MQPKALELYQKVISESTQKSELLTAYAEMVKINIRQVVSVDPNTPTTVIDTDATLSSILSDYKDEKKLGFHVFQIGEEYYLRAEKALQRGEQEQPAIDFLKAIAIWEKNISQITDAHHRYLAYYYSAVAYHNLKQEDKAVEYYKIVVNQWPDQEKAWYAQFQIAQIYEILKGQGKATSEQVRSAWQTLLERYPNCSAAKLANKRLKAL